MAFDFESLLAGPSEKDKQAALTQGLLAAGLGMLSNNRSKNAGMAIGQGGLLGLQAYQGSLGQSRQEAMQRLQMAMMADKVRKEREAEQRWNNFVGGQVSPTAALAQGAQVGDIGPTVTNAERMNQSGDEIFPGVPRQYLQQLGPQAGQALLAKILEDQAKMTEFDKLTRGMPREKRDLALDTKLNIAPRPIQQDFGGSIGFGTIDPRNGMPTFAGNMPKTAAPGAIPFELSDLTPPEARGFKLQNSKASATNVDFRPIIKTGDSLASQVGPMMKESTAAAEGAVRQVQAAQQIVSAIDSGKVIAGPGANVRLGLSQIADLVNAGGNDNAERIANTRQAIRGLAQLTLQGRKQMRGEGAITENESKLAERAESGDISFTAAEIKQLAQASERAARFVYADHQRKLKVMQENPGLSGIAPFFSGPEMPAAQAGPSIPPPPPGFQVQPR